MDGVAALRKERGTSGLVNVRPIRVLAAGTGAG